MSLVINHNVMADSAARNLGATYSQMSRSVSRLSSGLRITDASDDAAGLAVRELMRADIAAVGQGIRNANDAIGMLQTFDGAAQVIDEKLIRMKELAEQAATGTYDDTQRGIIHAEFNEMRNEIERIAQATNFNNIYGLNSATQTLTIHFGPNNSSAEDFYSVQARDMTSEGLEINELTIASQASAQAALEAITSAITAKDEGRAHFGAMINRLRNTVTAMEIQRENLQAAESQISDADVAYEMTQMTRNQVLAQAGVSMLAQANMIPQMALQLLV